MQNLGRFREMKLNKVIFFCLFSMFFSVFTGGYLAGLAALEKQIVPCQACLKFNRDGAIGPLVHYDLFFRKNYTFGYNNPLNLTG